MRALINGYCQNKNIKLLVFILCYAWSKLKRSLQRHLQIKFKAIEYFLPTVWKTWPSKCQTRGPEFGPNLLYWKYYLEQKSSFTWSKNSFYHKLWTNQSISWLSLFIWHLAMVTPASMDYCNDLYGFKRYFFRPCHLTFCAILCQFLYSCWLSLMCSSLRNSLEAKV